MSVIELLFGLIASNTNLLSVDNNNKIAHIQMTAEYWLVLTHKQAGYLGS
jgi:hypothetical protein